MALIQYKCPKCGGSVEFDPSAQKMKCPYCDTEFDIDDIRQLQEIEKEKKTDSFDWEDKPDSTWTDEEGKTMSVYVCESCGGEVIADATLAATTCPYCGNAVVMKGRLSGMLKPKMVIPFHKNKEDAKAAYHEHLKGKRLLPKVFSSENHIDEIKGLYVPVWLFDADADADYTFNAERVRTWSDSRYHYVETSHYRLFRSGNLGFEKVPVDGSAKLDNVLMESIEPYDFSEAVDFQTAYLSGYLADKYDVSAKESEERANERIRSSVDNEFRATAQSYSSVTTADSSVRLKNGKYMYVLYPLWILSTSWRGEQYTFVMNGQTGKMAANLPTDKGAFARWFALLFVIGTAAGFGITWLINMFI